MTTAAATACAVRMTDDEGFSEQLAASPDADTRLQVARDAGYDLTLDELPAVNDPNGIQELSDDQLDNVAGGVNYDLLSVTLMM